MTADRCKWNGSGQPRLLSGRHGEGCNDETCPGCQTCDLPHCVVCGISHSLGACPACVAEVRDGLDEIARMCADLPAEAEVRGVDGEAMTLLGPAADPEAWGHHEASARAGRIDPGYLNVPRDEAHPLWVTGTWAMVYRDAFEHDEPSSRATLADELGYLRRNLSHAATFEHVPFEDFAHDVRRCVAHLQAVLHDQERGERANIACFDCGSDIERRLGKAGFEDVWTCRGRGCGRRYTIAEYNFALRAALEESA